METIAEIIAFCKAQSAYHTKRAAWRNIKPEAEASHKKFSAQFDAAVRLLERLPSQNPAGESGQSAQSDLFAIDPFDLDGLPEDLVSELTISRADQEDAQIIQLFRIAQRPLNINEVMVGLYRKFDVRQKRTAVSARLYRMAARGELVNVEKGVYSLGLTRSLPLGESLQEEKSPP
ncbi:MAG TPA: hypothetical protein VFH52_06385 [Rhodanobacteraceae bacterium]|nr:hypothetical protein [Rhodanobacteraceae bacterium]